MIRGAGGSLQWKQVYNGGGNVRGGNGAYFSSSGFSGGMNRFRGGAMLNREMTNNYSMYRANRGYYIRPRGQSRGRMPGLVGFAKFPGRTMPMNRLGKNANNLSFRRGKRASFFVRSGRGRGMAFNRNTGFNNNNNTNEENYVDNIYGNNIGKNFRRGRFNNGGGFTGFRNYNGIINGPNRRFRGRNSMNSFRGGRRFNSGRGGLRVGRRIWRNQNESKSLEQTLDMELDKYMGDDAIKNRLDKELDSYFNRMDNSDNINDESILDGNKNHNIDMDVNMDGGGSSF